MGTSSASKIWVLIRKTTPKELNSAYLNSTTVTLQELKDKIAKQKGYDDWNDVILFSGYRNAMQMMDEIAIKWALYNSKAFKLWCDHQVIHGRTTHKLYVDWQESLLIPKP